MLSACSGKTFVLVCLYPLDFSIQVVLGSMTYLPFGILLISHLLNLGTSLKSILISCSSESMSKASVSPGYISVAVSISLHGGL